MDPPTSTNTLSDRVAQLDRVTSLARYPNLALKWCHAPSRFSAEPYPFRDLQAQVRQVIEAFKPQRILWGSDALWTGLPVVTCLGETFASRVGASLLNAVHLPELVTTTASEYELLAIGLAQDPARLAALKAKLARHRLTTPLFDTPQFTRDIEAAYTVMVQRHRTGLPPDHIRMKRSTADSQPLAARPDSAQATNDPAASDMTARAPVQQL